MKKLIPRKSATLFLFFLPLICSLPSLVSAQGFQINLQGQKQISMGGTGSGTSLDAASMAYNPGSISFLKDNSVMAGVSPLFLRVGYAAASPSIYQASFGSLEPPFSGYATFGAPKDKLRFGIGVYTPFGGAAKWGDAWAGKFILEDLKLRAIFIQPTLSYKISDQVSLGAGFIFATGSVNLTKAIPLTDSSGADGQASLNGNAHGFGFNAGLFFRPTEELTLGLSYRSQVNMKAKNGTADFTVPASLAADFPSGNTFSTTLNLPSSINVGAGYQVSPRLLLSAEANFVNWSVYKKLEFDYAKTTPVLQNTVSPRNYEDSYDLRVGGQYKIMHEFYARAGFTFGATPVKDGYVSPEAPDANRIELSAGLGYTLAHKFTIDASFLYVDIMKRTQTTIETNFSGTFKTSAYIPGISLAYHF